VKRIPYLFFVFLFGCSSPIVSPGMTFIQRLDQYREGVSLLEDKPDRWPYRQGLAERLKTQYALTFGRSVEFNRIADLEYRRREFEITLREPSLKPERAREIREELIQTDKTMEELKDAVREQIAKAEWEAAREKPQQIEAIAAIGLVTLAIDKFTSPDTPGQTFYPSTKVGEYTVADHGSFSTVRTPDGKIYNCTPVLFDEGANIKCSPPGSAP
jgi:hypothetical protein